MTNKILQLVVAVFLAVAPGSVCVAVAVCLVHPKSRGWAKNQVRQLVKKVGEHVQLTAQANRSLKQSC
jgi:hypothetical protein